MPHIIIEFSQGLTSDAQIEGLLDTLHQATVGCGLFDESHIRVRARSIAYYRVGGVKRDFIHAQCRIHAGRNVSQKQMLSEAVLSAIKAQEWAAGVITVEVVDMDKSTYSKYEKDASQGFQAIRNIMNNKKETNNE